EGQRLAHVADHELQSRIPVERSAENNTNHVDRGFDVPTPARPGEHIRHYRRKPTVRCLDHWLGRWGWMEINRYVEGLGTLENRPEKFVIEITAADMTIDDRPLETIIMDGSLQFGGRGIGVCGRQRGKPTETSRMAPHGIPDVIVRFARERRRFCGFELLRAG